MIRAYRCHPFHSQRLSQAVVAGWLHMSQAAVCRLENGRRRLTIDEIDSFARALGLCTALRWTPQQYEVKEDVEPISRRSLLGAGAGAAFGLSATTPAAAREINPELVSHWVKLLRLLDRHDAIFGSRDVLATVRHELDLIAEHRNIARGALRTDLLRVESRWSQFASWLSNDAGNERDRDAWADHALRLAHEGDYPEMAAYVRTRQSRWAAEDHDARRAITFAEAGAQIRGASDQVRALCTLRTAHGHALAHDAIACERSLANAYELLDRADTPQSPWHELARLEVSPPYVLADKARCWLSLRPSKAIGMLEDVLDIWPRDRARSRGVQHARLARASAATDDPDRAAAEGMKALDIARVTRSHMTVRELRSLDQQLAACDLPQAADFREAFATL